MSLTPGGRIGAYEVVSLVGAGGMGEVYRARDTKLQRDVALKVLPDVVAADPERVARFRREAQLLAALNHSNIGGIYGLEEGGDRSALVLEFVDGPTLADRIAQGPIPLDEALAIARQIAEALEAAHEQNIIHRDLKPANIKLRPDGTVKVLDFGLAKAHDVVAVTSPVADPAIGIVGFSNSPTLTTPAMTGIGVILGTAAYMSPEQAKGKPADKRSDVWAFGCVMYEMLTGRRAFAGDDVSDTLAAVLRGEPDWTLLPANTPPDIVRLLQRCVRKERRARTPDVAVARQVLEDAPAAAAQDDHRARWPLIAAMSLSTLAVVLFAVLAASWLRADVTRPSAIRYVIDVGQTGQLVTRIGETLRIARDGSFAVYTLERDGQPRSYVRRFDQLRHVEIPGSDITGAGSFFLSPGGEWLVVNTGRTLRKLGIQGAATATIAAETALGSGGLRGGTWGAAGEVVFAANGVAPLLRVSENGGQVAELTKPAEDESHVQPHFLPDGDGLLFSVRRPGHPHAIAVTSIRDGRARVLIDGAQPRYAAGRVFFWRDMTLWSVPFDTRSRTLQGEARPAVEGIEGGPNYGIFDVSASGALVYVPRGVAQDAERVLVWVDRNGREEPAAAVKGVLETPRLSPDGARIAVGVGGDISVVDVGTPTQMRLTFDPALDLRPVWSPDGKWIYFRSDAEGSAAIYRKASDGSGEATKLASISGDGSANFATTDGKYLLFTQIDRTTLRDVWMLDLETYRETALIVEPGGQGNPVVSPNGKWLAYGVEQGGAIVVRPFPNVAEGRWEVVPSGAKWPAWSADGRELFYQAGQSINAVRVVDDAGSFKSTAPRQLFEGPYVGFGNLFGSRGYDVARDGRFLVVRNIATTEVTRSEIVVVQNWLSEVGETR